MPRRLLERIAEHPLDDHLVGEADAQREPSTGGHLGGQRLLGHEQGVARIGGDHRAAHLDTGHLASHDRQGDEGVEAEDVGDPHRGEAILRRLPGAADQIRDGVGAAALTEEDADAHGGEA